MSKHSNFPAGVGNSEDPISSVRQIDAGISYKDTKPKKNMWHHIYSYIYNYINIYIYIYIYMYTIIGKKHTKYTL